MSDRTPTRFPILTPDRDALKKLQRDRLAREAWVAEDPSRLFALLQLDQPTESDLADFDRRLATVLETIPGPIAPPVRSAPAVLRIGRWVVAAGIAGLLVWFGSQWNPSQDGLPQVSGSGTEEVVEFGAVQPPVDVVIPAMRGDVLHGIDLLETPGEARIVDFSVGQTRVVMIFDKELDL